MIPVHLELAVQTQKIQSAIDNNTEHANPKIIILSNSK